MTKFAAPWLLLLLAGCGEDSNRNSSAAAPAIERPAADRPLPRQTSLIPVPDDPAQLARLQAAGYTIHDKHLHEPGVAACPMDMGSNPIQ